MLAGLAKAPGVSRRAAHAPGIAEPRPLLFRWLERAVDPDMALNQFIRFVEAYGLRSMLFELLVELKLLELVKHSIRVASLATR